MNRISGPMAVLAGLVLMIPGLFAVFHAASSATAMPGWLVRDLALCSLTGIGLMVAGAVSIRHRELELHDLQPIRVRR